jgi:hypothetical protein
MAATRTPIMASRRAKMLPITRLPDPLNATRQTLHRVAAHVLGRRRYEVCGRFGLRASPGGFATPAYGAGPEILRVAGETIVRETATDAAYLTITGSSIRTVASFAGADLEAGFSSGPDTPGLGDLDAPLEVDVAAAAALADWYSLGWQVLDQVLTGLPADAEPAVVQLWPEHFDVGTNVGLPSRSRVNLGASPGDSFSNKPYLYVGPWGADRPGDPAFWNAPFGAVLGWAELVDAPNSVDTGVAFLRTGLQHSRGAETS